jgi:hypothetical protein
MNAFTKTLQTLHFVQSQRAVENIAAVEAVTLHPIAKTPAEYHR